MAKQINQLAELQHYVRGVVDRANHHAANVLDVLEPLLLQVVCHHDPGSLACRTYNGHPTNILRFAVRGHAVALAYDHAGHVDLREGTERGRVLASFTNATRQTIEPAFAQL